MLKLSLVGCPSGALRSSHTVHESNKPGNDIRFVGCRLCSDNGCWTGGYDTHSCNSCFFFLSMLWPSWNFPKLSLVARSLPPLNFSMAMIGLQIYRSFYGFRIIALADGGMCQKWHHSCLIFFFVSWCAAGMVGLKMEGCDCIGLYRHAAAWKDQTLGRKLWRNLWSLCFLFRLLLLLYQHWCRGFL